MQNILVVTSSAQGESSVSNRLVRAFLERARALHPAADVTLRDIGAEPVPHLTPDNVAAIRGTPASDAEQAARALSDTLIEELRRADLLVIGSPMYNFGISSTLKAWFDHVLRAGVTFRYTEAGPEGLMVGKKAVVIESRAGLYSEGPAGAMDGQEPHLRTMLGFMGIDDATFVRAERLAFGPEAADAAIAEAEAALHAFAGEALKLAA
jgi:FMN-dependent NADH-azoreductase